MLPDAVIQKLDALPAQPGVYLFKDKKGVVVYVGKAKSLRSRVRSYFQEARSDERYFIPLLQRTIGDLETIVTATEKEAAILENNLIKEHQPRYNVKLRDDKDFISLRLRGPPRREPAARVPAAPADALARRSRRASPRRRRGRDTERRRVAAARGRAPADAGRRATSARTTRRRPRGARSTS